MSSKTNINGTDYEIVSGKVNIGGANYSITKGKVNINGAYYTINFGTVPYAYQQVEYVQHKDNTIAYFTLPITTQEGLKLECEIWRDGYADNQCRIGTASSITSYARQYFQLEDDGESYFYAVASCAGNSVTSGYAFSGYNITINFGNYGVTNKISVNFNNRTTEANRTRTLSATGNTIYLMSSTTALWGKYGIIRAYNSSNNLIMELYPVYRKSDNKPGFWDTISRQFLTKSGSGAITVGPDV